MVQQRRVTVAVVGAGAIGLAAALQLRRAGVNGVTVIDRNPSPGMGSTGRANGGVRAQFTTPINIEFSRYTIPALAALDRQSGGQVGYRPVGYLFMAGTDATADALRRACELQHSLGVDVTMVSQRRVLELAPFVRTEGILAATYCSSDGIVDPHGVTAALRSAADDAGVTWLFGAGVTGIDAGSRGATVRCGSTHVVADFVVNAAGPDARQVASLAGVDLPVTAYRRNLACTEAVAGLPERLPMCVDADTGLLIRREAGGVLIGFSDPADPPCTDDTFDPGFLVAVATRAGNRFPFLESVSVDSRKCWAGLYPETTDHHAIVDAPREAPWFVQCAGFGGHGIMHCLAAGQAVAETIRDGSCTTFDLRPLRLNRFGGVAPIMETAVL